MPLPWPMIENSGGDLADETQAEARVLLDGFADEVVALLDAAGLPPTSSSLFRPWNLVVVVDAEKLVAVFGQLQGGLALVRWLDRTAELVDPQQVSNQVQVELGQQVAAWVSFPRAALEPSASGPSIAVAAQHHVAAVERQSRLGRLGDLTGLAHLEPALRAFLEDHPEPAKNVFIMMRFLDSPQMAEIHETIKSTLAANGFHGIRADDRDYTGELWSNIEVCMTGCTYGVAVFEDIDERDFNPNVSLELGYMLGRRKRCLLLKERRLPDLPTDVIHRLYKPFDMFALAETVHAQLLRWIQVDLGALT